MAKYAIMFTFTPEAWAAIIKNPSDRAGQAAAVAKSLGGSLESYYWMTGGHDGIAVFDVPDGVTAGAASIAVNSTGNFTAVSTHQLFDADDRNALTEKAKTVLADYRPPTG